MNKTFIAAALVASALQITPSSAQLMRAKDLYTKADSLRGELTPLRSCYDVIYYHLDVKVDIDHKFISGSNLFEFKAVNDFKKLQFDLFDNLSVDKIEYKGQELDFQREYNAVYVNFPKTIKQGEIDRFKVYYSGNPVTATRAPWDGGFDWKKDSKGNPFVATAVQGFGASAWWPVKDHLSDEPDSMLISASIPKGLINVSNGRLLSTKDLNNGYVQYNWKVTNPINNYNVALNIGNYVHFSEKYHSEKGPLDVEYYILAENDTEQKKAHLKKNVQQTLEAFEYWFGPYPFFSDSYKIVETAHLGMEHQSAIAYGNKYQNGYLGRDGSGTGWGKKWDFIVVHESGHEWFGNNITAADLADMWIHESFTNYSEALFIDYFYGKQASSEYVHGNRKGILNDAPLQGPYGLNKEGSSDMYLKGGVLLHMIRSMIDEDTKWREILRGLNKDFKYKQVNYSDITSYLSEKSGIDLSKVFEQYVQHTGIPTLEIKFNDKGEALARWRSEVKNFHMPIHLGNQKHKIRQTLNDEFTKIQLEGLHKDNIQVDTYNYYIQVDII